MGSTVRAFSRLVVYLAWTLPLMPLQFVLMAAGRPWVLPRFYHRQCCRILGLRLRTIGAPIDIRPALFAANHVSYLDITVFGSLLSAGFVTKHEVKGWPLFGWLARLQRSVFVDRRVRSTVQQRDSIANRLVEGDALILFPEGTSGDGNRVLPFKSALFSVADRSALPVQPVSIAYTRLDGMPIGRHLRPLFAWYGAMAMAPHLWRVLGLGTVEIVIEFHAPATLAECGSRKALARYCQERVAAGVAAALDGRRRVPPTAFPAPQRQPAAADAPAAAVG